MLIQRCLTIKNIYGCNNCVGKKIKLILVYTKNLLTIIKKKLQTDITPSIKRIIVFCTSYITLVGVPLLRKMTVRSRDQPFLLNCNSSTNYKNP